MSAAARTPTNTAPETLPRNQRDSLDSPIFKSCLNPCRRDPAEDAGHGGLREAHECYIAISPRPHASSATVSYLSGGLARGNRTVNVAPSPGCESALMVPPCARTS